MKILVTGGTGYTGHHLSKRLLQDGHQVRLLVRSKDRVALLPHEALEVVVGDVTDKRAVDNAVIGVDKVFNFAAMYRVAGSNDQGYRNVHVEGTRFLVEASIKFGIKRFVQCSTVGVHGHIENPPATEESPYAPADIYQSTKLEGELLARELADKAGLPLTVVRPTAIYGPGDMRLLKLFRLASRKIVPVIGQGKIFYHMTYIDDIIDGFILAGERKEASGEVFIIGGNEILSLNDLLSTIAKIFGAPDKKVHLPAAPFQFLGYLCEMICIPIGIEPPIYRRRVDFFTKSRSFDISKAKNLLGFSPKVSIEEGLRRSVQWYREKKML